MYTNVGVYVPSTMNVQDVQFYSRKLYIICPSDVLYDLVACNMYNKSEDPQLCI